MSNWLFYAVAAMLLLAAANVALKAFVKDYSLPAGFDWGSLALVLAGGLLVAWGSQRFLGLQGGLLWLAVLSVALSLAGYALIVLALQQGKVAVVAAVLSLGTVVVALASIHFFGDRFTVKEALAMIFAIISVLALVI